VKGKKETNGGDEPNWDTLYADMEMSHPLYNYYILYKNV
jgi:hypothetical protein